jgi:hypothetical protein
MLDDLSSPPPIPVIYQDRIPQTNFAIPSDTPTRTRVVEFIYYLDCFRLLAVSNQRNLGRDSSTTKASIELIAIHRRFAPGKPLSRLLRRSFQLREGYPGGERVPQIQEVGLLVCRLYLNLVLWEYRNAPGKVDELFAQIEDLVAIQGVDCLESCELFIWTILIVAIGSRFERRERVLLVSRMGNIAKRMTERDFSTVNNMLIQCLRGDGLGDLLSWDAKNVRWDAISMLE